MYFYLTRTDCFTNTFSHVYSYLCEVLVIKSIYFMTSQIYVLVFFPCGISINLELNIIKINKVIIHVNQIPYI